MPNTNFQTFHQMGQAINEVVRQATGRDAVQNIEMDHVTVAQNHYYEEVTLSASRVSFPDRVGNTPLEKCVVQIEPVQDLHGYGKPWPAGGGKNIYPPGNRFHVGVAPVVAGKTYTISVSKEPTNDHAYNFGYLTSDDTWTAMGNILPPTLTSARRTVTIPEGVVGINVYDINASIIDVQTQIELGSVATDFEPYSNICPITGWTEANIHVSPTTNAQDGQTYSIAFPAEAGTVYGGTLDALNGVLTVDRASILMRDAPITKSSTNFSTWRIKPPIEPAPIVDRNAVLVISSIYEGLSYNEASTSGNNYVFLADGGRISIKHTATAGLTVEEYKSQYGDVRFVYYIATPLTYQLTPQQITTLLGTNTIWADTGNIEVTIKVLKELY